MLIVLLSTISTALLLISKLAKHNDAYDARANNAYDDGVNNNKDVDRWGRLMAVANQQEGRGTCAIDDDNEG